MSKKEFTKADILKRLVENVGEDDFDTKQQPEENPELSNIEVEFDPEGNFTLGEDPQGNQYIIKNAFTEMPEFIPVKK